MPALPPGFQLKSGADDPFAAAIRQATVDAEPGSTFWHADGEWCHAAVVLTPDCPIDTRTLTNLGLLALFDALAVLAPPQVPLHIAGRASLRIDGADAATVRAAHAPGPAPAWAVLGIDVALQTATSDPGDQLDETCLAEEGFGDVAALDVLAHFCRHLLAWIDAWRDEGAAALDRAVAERACGVAVRA